MAPMLWYSQTEWLIFIALAVCIAALPMIL